MLTTLDIAVIGCGSAGSAAAMLLTRQSHRVTVFERVADPKPVGAGIVLQPTGLHVLHSLGLASELVPRGARIDRLWARTWKKKTVVDLHYGLINPHYFGLGMHRGALFQALFGGVTSLGVPVRCGVDVVDVRGADERDTVLIDAAGVEHGPYDLVIVGAGARTGLRDAVGIKHRCRTYPWGALWAIEEDTGGLFSNDNTLLQYVRGAKTMLGFLPTGLGPRGDVPLVSLYWSIRNDRVDAWRDAGLSRWREQIVAADARAEPVLAQIASLDEVVHGPYFDVILKRPYRGKVIFLGDAAHATSPQLGQGCNLALYDAWVFAASVADNDSVGAALQDYVRRRRRHLGYYQWSTRFLTPFFQSDSRFLGWLRDTFMGPMSAIKPLARIMAGSMCGIRRGVIRGGNISVPPLALPAPQRSATTEEDTT